MKYRVCRRPVTIGRKTHQVGSVFDSQPSNMGKRSSGYDAACQVLVRGGDLEAVLSPKAEAEAKAAAATLALEEATEALKVAEDQVVEVESEGPDVKEPKRSREEFAELQAKPKRKRRTKAEMAADELQAQSQAEDAELERILAEENTDSE